MIKISNTLGVFDLSPDTALSIELTNPLLSEQGSLSLPFTFLRTEHNDYLLGFPSRTDRKQAIPNRQEVTIESGLFSEVAELEILSISPDAVEATLYLYESSFYSRAKEVKLTEVFEGVIRRWDSDDVDIDTRINNILGILLDSAICNTDHEDYAVFPLACSVTLPEQVDKSIISGATGQLVAKANLPKILNNVYVDNRQGDAQIPVYQFLAYWSNRSYYDDNDNLIYLPKGYGITLFLRVGYVLNRIFEFFGYTLNTNLFSSGVYRRWCVVNNTADAILPGYVIEKQLVPDITVNEFLDIVREGINADFFINIREKTVSITGFNDIVSAGSDDDLTQYRTAALDKLELHTPKQVKITLDTGLPQSKPAVETRSEMYEDYPGIIDNLYGAFQQNTIVRYGSGYWKIYDFKLSSWLTTSAKVEWLGSNNFINPLDADIDEETHAFPAKAFVNFPVQLSPNPIGWNLTSSQNYITSSMPIIDKFRNLNSFVVIDSEQQEESVSELPLIIARESFGNPNVVNTAYNSSLQIDNADSNYDIYPRFWQQYSEILKTSFHRITYSFRLPVNKLYNFRFDRLKNVDGQALMPESLKYTLSDDEYVNVVADFRTVRPMQSD
jgi:hypothetical protein